MTASTNTAKDAEAKVDPVVAGNISAALGDLNLDDDGVETIDRAAADPSPRAADFANGNMPPHPHFNGGMPPNMFPGQPPMMNMGFMGYNQMMPPMPHQQGFFGPGDFQDNSNSNANNAMGNIPGPMMPGPMMFGQNGDMGAFANPLNGMPNFVPGMDAAASTEPAGVPVTGATGFNEDLWPNSTRTQSNTAELTEPAAGEAASNVAFRRQTFHTISSTSASANATTVTTTETTAAALESTTTTTGATTMRTMSAAVGAKTRTKSTSVQSADRDALFATPSASELAKDSDAKNSDSDSKGKKKDMSNPQTYAAAYPYGGPALQHMNADGSPMMNGMPSPFPGRYDFAGGAPFQPFAPMGAHPGGPMPGHSALPHMSPSPVPFAGMPGNENMPNGGGAAGQDDTHMQMHPHPHGFPPMMQNPHGHPQNGSPPPWMYNGPPFNGMVPPMNGHHGNMNMMGNGNHNGKGSGRGNGKNVHFHGKNRHGRGNYYGNNNNGNGNNSQYSQAKMEEAARFADATLDEFVGNMYSICKDQHGCRFLQKQLDTLGAPAADQIFAETKEHAVELMTDSFGNYLIQKLIEKITPEQKIELCQIAAPNFVEIAMNPHGTRALQKLIECSSSDVEAKIIIDSLRDAVVDLSKDLNGNHVIQKCLQTLEPENFQFIFDAICNDCVTIATHRHGCCVLQRCLDYGTKEQCNTLCDKLLSLIDRLTLDPFGNYVVQYIITKETEKKEYDYTYKIVHLIKLKIVELSVHKFGSNVIEKLLRTPVVAETLILELVNNKGEADIKILLNDSYGNYVLQTALDVAHDQNDSIHDKLSAMVTPLLVGPIRNTPHGKRIVAMLHLEEQ
ncbi:Puf4 protein [Maudiozyma humilis]|uniref:Puf4 protein n=1 Tax=Maudiozyma humilis TaxID=51915 RepID=A0AAV5S1R8_MAUHU|nr:Puf4 protein [Kazachstania humilis]